MEPPFEPRGHGITDPTYLNWKEPGPDEVVGLVRCNSSLGQPYVKGYDGYAKSRSDVDCRVERLSDTCPPLDWRLSLTLAREEGRWPFANWIEFAWNSHRELGKYSVYFTDAVVESFTYCPNGDVRTTGRVYYLAPWPFVTYDSPHPLAAVSGQLDGCMEPPGDCYFAEYTRLNAGVQGNCKTPALGRANGPTRALCCSPKGRTSGAVSTHGKPGKRAVSRAATLVTGSRSSRCAMPLAGAMSTWPQMRVPDRLDEKADDLFAAFSHRTHPVDGYYGNDEAAAVKAYLKHVAPRQLTFEVLHACPEPEMSILPNMKLDTQLYYAPSFLSLCVEDWDRLHSDASVLLYLFLRNESIGADLYRFSDLCPARFLTSFRTSLAKFPASRWKTTPHAMARLQEWFYAGFRPSDIPFLAALTAPEKRAIARAYRFLQRTYRSAWDTDEGLFGRAMHAACAMLNGGNSLPDALGATCPEECRYLVDVLEMFEAEFPDEFPRPRTRPIIAALRRHLSG